MLDRLSLNDTLETFDIRAARDADIPALVRFYREFFKVSTLPALGLVFDADSTAQWLRRVLPDGSPHILAMTKDYRLAGSINYNLDHNGLVAPYASLDKFYIRPQYRKSGLGRLLLTCAMSDAHDAGAVAFRAGVSSGIGTAVNLFRKLGFNDCAGSILLEREL